MSYDTIMKISGTTVILMLIIAGVCFYLGYSAGSWHTENELEETNHYLKDEMLEIDITVTGDKKGMFEIETLDGYTYLDEYKIHEDEDLHTKLVLPWTGTFEELNLQMIFDGQNVGRYSIVTYNQHYEITVDI